MVIQISILKIELLLLYYSFQINLIYYDYYFRYNNRNELCVTKQFTTKIIAGYNYERSTLVQKIISTMVKNFVKFNEVEHILRMRDWCDSKLRFALQSKLFTTKCYHPSLAVVSFVLGYVKN